MDMDPGVYFEYISRFIWNINTFTAIVKVRAVLITKDRIIVVIREQKDNIYVLLITPASICAMKLKLE